jgi:hypothetical protein
MTRRAEVIIREPRPDDWAGIGRLADAAVAHIPGAPRQAEWVANRQTFSGLRRHHVAVRSGSVLGYAALEESSTTAPFSFRAFIVMDWGKPNEFSRPLWSMIEADLVELRATEVWMREYAGDSPIAAFVGEQGLAPKVPVPTDPLEHVLFSRTGPPVVTT